MPVASRLDILRPALTSRPDMIGHLLVSLHPHATEGTVLGHLDAFLHAYRTPTAHHTHCEQLITFPKPNQSRVRNLVAKPASRVGERHRVPALKPIELQMIG